MVLVSSTLCGQCATSSTGCASGLDTGSWSSRPSQRLPEGSFCAYGPTAQPKNISPHEFFFFSAPGVAQIWKHILPREPAQRAAMQPAVEPSVVSKERVATASPCSERQCGEADRDWIRLLQRCLGVWLTSKESEAGSMMAAPAASRSCAASSRCRHAPRVELS